MSIDDSAESPQRRRKQGKDRKAGGNTVRNAEECAKLYEGPEGAGVGEMRTSRSDGDEATGRGVRAEAGMSTESSRGMRLTREEKCGIGRAHV